MASAINLEGYGMRKDIMKRKCIFSGVITMLILVSLSFISSQKVKAESTSSPSDFIIEDGILVKYTGTATNVIVPEGVTQIGGRGYAEDNGFIENHNITSITLPDSLTTIGVFAFYMCTDLTKIDIPENVTTIERLAFGHCSNLSEVNIPEKTIIKDKDAFLGTLWLKAKEVESDLLIINNVLVSGYNAEGEVTIPEGVTQLAGSSLAFTKITKAYLPKSLVKIGDSAFSTSTLLEEVDMKDNVTSIGEFAFEGCRKLKKIEIPESVKEIGENILWQREKHITLLVHKDSAMHKYANKNNLKYEVIGSDSKKEVPKYTVIKVKKGDTLWGISRKYLGSGKKYKEIMKLNKLKSTIIYVGQKIKVPTK